MCASNKKSIIDNGNLVPIGPLLPSQIKVWVGIDFGTSSTKLAYRVLGGAGKVYPLKIGENKATPYITPSLIALDGRKILFGDDADLYLKSRPWHEGARYLKILFAGEINPAFRDEEMFTRFNEYCDRQEIESNILKPGYMVSAYLAQLIKKIRQHVNRHIDKNLLLNFNICMPIDSYEMKDVKAGFQKAINVAEEVEKIWDGKDTADLLEYVALLWNEATEEEEGDSKVHLVPEAVAQMVSYLNSLSAENKIHGVIDFGAGTTDFSIFKLGCDERDKKCAYWYSAVTLPGGMSKIEQEIAGIYEKTGQMIEFSKIQTTLTRITEADQPFNKIIKENLGEIWEQSRFSAWGRAYLKNPDTSNWRGEKVKIFVCGGGMKLPFIKEIFERSWQQKPEELGPYRISVLKAPSNYEGPPEDFYRMAVAYGLTVPRPELVRYILPSKCPTEKKEKYVPRNDFEGTWGPVYNDTH